MLATSIRNIVITEQEKKKKFQTYRQQQKQEQVVYKANVKKHKQVG